MTRINKYAGACRVCGARVAEGAGRAVLTDKGWRVECAAPCQPNPVARAAARQEAPDVGDLAAVMALFDKAKARLKYPAIVLRVPALDADYAIRVNVAGERASEPGSLTVLDALERRASDGRRVYRGKVTRAGRYVAPPDLRGSQEAVEIGKRLAEFAADPIAVARQYAAATKPGANLAGRCMFCNLPLEDERSTAAGYGKKCSQNWGLPWGGRPDEIGDAPGTKQKKARRSRADRFVAEAGDATFEKTPGPAALPWQSRFSGLDV